MCDSVCKTNAEAGCAAPEPAQADPTPEHPLNAILARLHAKLDAIIKSRQDERARIESICQTVIDWAAERNPRIARMLKLGHDPSEAIYDTGCAVAGAALEESGIQYLAYAPCDTWWACTDGEDHPDPSDDALDVWEAVRDALTPLGAGGTTFPFALDMLRVQRVEWQCPPEGACEEKPELCKLAETCVVVRLGITDSRRPVRCIVVPITE
ncbi:MAG: hypothetical protein WC700_14940 [Gemmatimonadaceae bacterium]|jgi:hypothetical protein